MFNKKSNLHTPIDLTGLSKEDAVVKIVHNVFDFWQREKGNYRSNKEMMPFIIDAFVGHKISNAGARYSNSNDYALVPPFMGPALLASCAVEPILVAYGYTLELGDRKKFIEICNAEFDDMQKQGI